MSVLDALKILSPPPEPIPTDRLGAAIKAYMDGLPEQVSYTDYLRASGMYFLCPREFVLNYWNPKPNKGFDAKATMMVNMGSIFHHYMQTWILGPMGILNGKWEKYLDGRHTGEVVVGFHPDPERAIWEIQHQDEATWEFVEDEVWIEKYRIKGHHDGKISKNRIIYMVESLKLLKEDSKKFCTRVHDLPVGEFALLEMKSNGKWTYDKINETSDIQPYYKQQAEIYQWLTGIHETYFLLFERDMFNMKGVNYSHTGKWINDTKYKAQKIWEAIRDCTLPESFMACSTPKDARAKSCVHAEECWSRRLDFKTFVEKCKERQPERKWLDLSTLTFED